MVWTKVLTGPYTYAEKERGGSSETLRYKIQMSSTATTWKREEIYNDTDSGRLLAIEYSCVETS